MGNATTLFGYLSKILIIVYILQVIYAFFADYFARYRPVSVPYVSRVGHKS